MPISKLLMFDDNVLMFQGVRNGVVGNDTKSNLDNIVGSLWQARQESSGSSVGNQVGMKIFLNEARTNIFQAGLDNSVNLHQQIIQTIFHVYNNTSH